ncbi:transglutaminaseTgpA domain-containing protein [Streptomyces avicenniae]|uniref:transglutaminase family protein n=1 Tax=Streptomyces avicenniae TaxID=500153 RepID=UPI000B1BF16C|nr:DUF3488 and transglutaminase-like domain-containing protein [Streptomyces avicenniae]
MDSRVRTACAAWVATMAAAVALLPLIDGSDWFAQAALLLAAQTATGMISRAVGAPGPVTFAAQLAVSLIVLTLVSAPDFAPGGFVPSPGALGELGRLLTAGAEDIGRYTAPAPETDGIRLMVFAGVLLIGLMVDVLAVTVRGAAAAGLPLLALYSVAAGVGGDDAGWPYFLAAAAGYLVLLLADGRDRAERWGRVFGAPGQDPSAARPGRAPRLRAGRRIGVLTLGVAVAVPALLPSLGSGLLDLTGESGRGSERSGNRASTSLDPVVALEQQLNQPQDSPVLYYRTTSPEASEMYLRMVALDEFDGERWTSSEWTEPSAPDPPWDVPGLGPEVPVTRVATEIQAAESYFQTSLPVPYPAQSIEAEGDWSFDRGSQTLTAGGADLSTRGLGYSVEHLLVEPTAAQLAQAPPAPEDLREYYTRLPDGLPEEVAAQAAEVTAGAGDDLERAVALQDWFTQDGGFRYDTSVTSGSGTEAIVAFLREREGFCVHFAFTMATMARTLGIPAQVAVGFTPGTRLADDTYEVSVHNAHAWPELYFDGVGWVRFEPTPGQGNSPAYTRPEAERDPAGREEREPEERESPEAVPSASADVPQGCAPGSSLPDCPTEQPRTPESARDAAGFSGWPLLWTGGGLLLAAALVSPLLWRRRVRGRRLGPDAGPLGAWQELTDSAWDFGITPAPSETPRAAAARIVRVASLTGEPAAAVHRVADAVERELYAPAADRGRAGRLAEDVRTARRGLRADAGRWRRLRATLAPHSSIRVIHRWSARRVALAHRLRTALRRLLPRRPRGHGA